MSGRACGWGGRWLSFEFERLPEAVVGGCAAADGGSQGKFLGGGALFHRDAAGRDGAGGRGRLREACAVSSQVPASAHARLTCSARRRLHCFEAGFGEARGLARWGAAGRKGRGQRPGGPWGGFNLTSVPLYIPPSVPAPCSLWWLTPRALCR